MAAGRDLLRSAELSLNFLERRAIWHAVINNFWFNLDAGLRLDSRRLVELQANTSCRYLRRQASPFVAALQIPCRPRPKRRGIPAGREGSTPTASRLVGPGIFTRSEMHEAGRRPFRLPGAVTASWNTANAVSSGRPHSPS